MCNDKRSIYFNSVGQSCYAYIAGIHSVATSFCITLNMFLVGGERYISKGQTYLKQF